MQEKGGYYQSGQVCGRLTAGCVGIADDVVVYGRDNTEHDKNLLRLMQVAKEEGLVFNSKKCVIKTSEIVFFGSVYGKDDIMLEVDDENACSIDLINFSINKRMQLREMSTADHTLCALQPVVYSGWPDTIKDLPKDLRPYWSYRDEIGISDGVIFKGKQVIIPDAMRSDILHSPRN